MRRNLLPFVVITLLITSCTRSGTTDTLPHYKQYTGIMYVTGASEFDVPVGADGKLNMEAHVYKMKAFVPDPPNTTSNYITVRVVGLWINEDIDAPNNELGYFVVPPKHNQFSDIIYNNFPTVTTLENNPNDIGRGSAVIETISFGYNNVRGVRLHAQFRAKYDLSKYVSSGQIRETIGTIITFSPYNVDWWANGGVWRKEPGVSGSIDITPYYKQE